MEAPACEVEEVCSTFSSPLRDCSTGRVMRSWTCSLEDPGAVVITCTCGRDTEGISSWRIVIIVIVPMIDAAMQTSAMKDRLFRLSWARRFILLLGRRGDDMAARRLAAPRGLGDGPSASHSVTGGHLRVSDLRRR